MVSSHKCISIVIPVYNEEGTIDQIVKKSKKHANNVIVVDDGSEDSTAKIAKKEGAIVLKHVINMGVGFATITGNDYAVKIGSDIIVNIDGDDQHEVDEVQDAIELLEKKELDIVIGSRFLGSPKQFPWVLKFGNRFLTFTNKLMFGSNVTDTQSGFRVLTSEAWEKLELNSSSYSICSEISAKIGTKRLRYGEIPISTKFLDKFKGTTAIDGINIFADMLGWWTRKWRS